MIVAVDDNNGMMFNCRRQSSDSVLRQHILDISSKSLLWMNPYTYKQFDGAPAHVKVSDAFLSKAGKGEYCFVENESIASISDKLEALIIYRWNRVYPSDLRLDFLPWGNGMHCTLTEEFKGHSHDKITMEVWQK